MGKKQRFTGKIGYVLAAAGSAIGLGNIWRFPYLTAKYGGGIFLLTYLILALTFGYALIIAENCIGRMTGKGPIGAFRDLCEGKKCFLGSLKIGGYVNALVPLIIIPYYCVIGGWIVKYVVAMLVEPMSLFSKDVPAASGAYFTQFIGSTWSPLVFFLLFVLFVVVVIAFGVLRGVERFSRVLMPLLFILILALCVYCAFLPDAGDGFRYYLMPDFSKFSHMTVVAAMGQLFFSLSIGMGIMITYGSYMRRRDDLVANVNQVEIFDTAAAFVSGLMIIPAVVAFGGRKAAESAGVGLVFITMPQVFANFPGGKFVGVAFFVFVFFAAATSAISLLETNVQTIGQELKVSRKTAIAIGTFEVVAVGVLTILGYSVLKNVHPLAFLEQYRNYDILDTLDFISNSVLMPVAAIFTTLLVVAVIGLERISKELRREGVKWRREYVFQLCMALLVIPCLLVILLNSLGILA